jgi:ferritin
MLSTKVEELLNAQVEKEGYSSLLYLSMASWAETKGYPGISQWLYAQADEEKNHMLEFIHYINDRGGKAMISGLKKPPESYQGIKQLFNDEYEEHRSKLKLEELDLPPPPDHYNLKIFIIEKTPSKQVGKYEVDWIYTIE